MNRFGIALASLLAAACSVPTRVELESLDASRTRLARDGWVGTWAASGYRDGTQFHDRTLRQIVHTSIGGASVRIHISNVFGSQPLVVAHAQVAERAQSAAIAPGTDRALTFAGESSVTVPAGQVAVSDPAVFEVLPLSDLAVTFHVLDSSDGTTAHGSSFQDNYFADGDVTGTQDLASAPGFKVQGGYYYLSNVDVQNPEAWGAVVTLGASITDGYVSSTNKNRRWPNDLAQRLNDAGIPVGVLNAGISGNKLLADGSGESALKRFQRDALDQPGVRWVVFSDDPINDLGSGKRPTGQQLIDGLKQLVAAAHAANVELWCSTLTPFQGSGGWSSEGETARQQVLDFVESAASGCDAIVNQDEATHDPAMPTQYRSDLDAGDHLHPNEKGLQAIADAVDLGGFSGPPTAGAAAGGSDATAGGGAGGASGASAGSGGANVSGADGGSGGSTAGGPSGAGGGSGGTGGSSGANAAAGSEQGLPLGSTAGATTAPSAAGSSAPSGSGCSCVVARGQAGRWPWAVVVLAAWVRRRRRVSLQRTRALQRRV